jgi:hypothetical protein
MIQTGANTQSGGVKEGFLNVAYQPPIAGLVKIEPITPASWQRIKLTASLKISILFKLIETPIFADNH